MLVTILILLAIVVLVVIVKRHVEDYEYEHRKNNIYFSKPIVRKLETCQFCEKDCYQPHWYNGNWCCAVCWKIKDLNNKNYRVVYEVEFEEIL